MNLNVLLRSLLFGFVLMHFLSACKKEGIDKNAPTLKLENLAGNSTKRFTIHNVIYSIYEKHPDSVKWGDGKSVLLFGYNSDRENAFLTFNRDRKYEFSPSLYETLKSRVPLSKAGAFSITKGYDGDVIGLEKMDFYVDLYLEKDPSKDLKETLIMYCVVPDEVTPVTKIHVYTLWFHVEE